MPTLPTPAADEASPPALNKRQQRSARRLQEFQEKKRAALVEELVSKRARSSSSHKASWRATSGSGSSTSRRSARRQWTRRPRPLKASRPAHRRQPRGSQAARSGLAFSHPKRAEREGGREGRGFVRRHVLVVCPLAAFPAVCSSDVVVA